MEHRPPEARPPLILSMNDLEPYRDDGLCGAGLDAARDILGDAPRPARELVAAYLAADAAYAGAYASARAGAYAAEAAADAADAARARVRNEIIEMVVAACEAATP